MKRLFSLLGITMLVVSFQNCSKTMTSAGSNQPAGVGSSNRQSAKDIEKVVFWDPQHSQYLDTDLKTGVMTVYEEYGQIRGESYCLTASDLQELQSMMRTSEICIPQVDYNAVKDRVCTTIYKYPYASLIRGSEEFRLGEMNTGCDVPTDLCGDSASMLKNYSTAVLKNLSSKTCPQ